MNKKFREWNFLEESIQLKLLRDQFLFDFRLANVFSSYREAPVPEDLRSRKIILDTKIKFWHRRGEEKFIRYWIKILTQSNKLKLLVFKQKVRQLNLVQRPNPRRLFWLTFTDLGLSSLKFETR